MNYREALDYLNGIIDYEKRTGYAYSVETFDLRRPEALLELLGNPQTKFPSILVAGTKGKGSTSTMIASILRASGRKVGLYSQPHLHSYRERIRVNNRLISPEEMARAVDEVVPAVEQLISTRPELGVPTTYEVTTAAAMLYFAAQQPDLVVLEVGLGGRLDATNVVKPLISVITPVSLDHMHLLGETIPEIAGEKAGIIKQDGQVIAAAQTDEALNVIRRTAAALGARLLVARPELEGAPVPGRPATLPDEEAAHPLRERTEVSLRGPSGTVYDLSIPLLGSHQVANAATAIAVVEQLAEHGFAVAPETVERGLAEVEWPGRIEIVSRRPLAIVDGAHNGDSARKLAAAIRENFAYRRLILVLGTSSDKDIPGICAALGPVSSMAIAARSRHPRAAEPEKLAAELGRWGIPVETAQDLPSAIEGAKAYASPQDLVCITGSLFVVADARDHFGLATEKDD